MEISARGKIISDCICRECAGNRSEIEKFIIEDYLDKQKNFRKKRKTCPLCGLMQDEWKRLGFAGCAFCYKIFRKEIASDIRKYHNGCSHRGKKPRNRICCVDESEFLKARMRKAVALCNFKQIKKIKKEYDEFVDKR